MGNDKKCDLKSAGILQVQNRIIWDWFSTLPVCWYSGFKKSSKFNRNFFQSYLWETIRTALQIVWVCFGC